MDTKTNAMRILDKLKISYQNYCYDATVALSGSEVAKVLDENPEQVFKTLVTISKSRKNYVFMIPVEKELNLKKAAACVHEKSVEMVKNKELLPTTGYVHGGCSPIGMKKSFPTVIDTSAQNFETIIFSGGRIGSQVEVAVADLPKAVRFQFAEIAE